MEISDLLTKAWSEVKRADIPAELHEIAFGEAVRLLAKSDRTPNEGMLRATKGDLGSDLNLAMDSETTGSDSAVDGEVEFFRKVSSETGVGQDKLRDVFHLANGEPRFNIAGRLLGGNLKIRMVTVAQALPVLRHYGLDEPETSTRVIRAECARLKILDEKNINSYLATLDGVTYVGSGRDRRLRVRPAGVRAFTQVIDRLSRSVAQGDSDANSNRVSPHTADNFPISRA